MVRKKKGWVGQKVDLRPGVYTKKVGRLGRVTRSYVKRLVER
jgi:hypothetical protein